MSVSGENIASMAAGYGGSPPETHTHAHTKSNIHKTILFNALVCKTQIAVYLRTYVCMLHTEHTLFLCPHLVRFSSGALGVDGGREGPLTSK